MLLLNRCRGPEVQALPGEVDCLIARLTLTYDAASDTYSPLAAVVPSVFPILVNFCSNKSFYVQVLWASELWEEQKPLPTKLETGRDKPFY